MTQRLKQYAMATLTGLYVGSIICLLIGLVDKSADYAIVLRAIRIGFEEHYLIVISAIIVAMLIPKIRGISKALIIGDNFDTTTISILSAAYVVVGCAIYSNQWIISDHPFYFTYLYILLLLIVVTRRFIAKFSPNWQLKTGSLTPDEPIRNKDLLSEQQITTTDNLIELITNQQQVKSIGLYGDWGTGKTSIYLSAKDEISKTNNNYIWVEVEPWRYTSQESLVLGFYETIGKALDDALPGVNTNAGNLLGIAEQLVRKNETTSSIAWVINIIRKFFQSSNDDPGHYIRKVLEREGKYLIVAIDNVERNNDSNQIIRTLQLVHFLKTPQITYIFISEKSRLLDALDHIKFIKNSTEYLEKFIEYELETVFPSNDELRLYFEKLVDDEAILHEIEFKNSLAKGFGSYRGVIKMHNIFMYELDKRFLNNGSYTVNLNDKLRLDYLKLKYPIIWKSIQENKDAYDDGMRDFDDMTYFSMSDDDRHSNNQQIILNPIEKNLLDADQLDVKDLLIDLFPHVESVLESNSKRPEYDEWRKERRVAIPDILDEYFAKSASLEGYNETIAKIDDTFRIFTEMGDTERNELMLETLRFIWSQQDPGATIRMFLGRLLSDKRSYNFKKLFIKSLLRSHARNYHVRSIDSDGVLAALMTGINELVDRYSGNSKKLNSELNSVFADITSYVREPSYVLRILLFAHPEQGNNYRNLNDWGINNEGYERFHERLLKWVDSYYFNDSTRSPFTKTHNKEWRFILFQWSQSIKAFGRESKVTSESERRFENVNKYIEKLMVSDLKLANRIMTSEFYTKDDYNRFMSRYKWQLSVDPLTPYSPKTLVAIGDAFKKLNDLSVRDNNKLEGFNEVLNQKLKVYESGNAGWSSSQFVPLKPRQR